MADDDGGIISEIADVAGGVVGAVTGEAKKFGQSATSQVSGSAPSKGSSSDDTSALDHLKKFGQSVTSQVTGSQPSSGTPSDKFNPFGLQLNDSGSNQPLLDNFKKFGQSVTAQATGGQQSMSDDDIKSLVKKDNDFSKKESAAVRARINRVYEEYAAKRAREKQQQEMAEKQKEEVKEVQEKEIKKEESNVAIQKTRAEIKNYGAE